MPGEWQEMPKVPRERRISSRLEDLSSGQIQGHM